MRINKFLVGLIFLILSTACGQATTPLLTDTPSPTATLAPLPSEAPNIRPFETISIDSPLVNQEISGGILTVTGYSEYFFESNLGVVLCGADPFGPGGGKAHYICGTEKNLISEGYATINSPDIGISGPFEGVLSYSVIEPTTARLYVFAASPMDGGIDHLTSVIITLLP